MRVGSSSISQTRTIAKGSVQKGIIKNQFKKFNAEVFDNFEVLNAWNPIRGTWSTSAGQLTTSTSASSYPILSSYDLRSQNILATLSLSAAGSGIVFWLQDENNWWAAVTFYTNSIESYNTGQYCCQENCYSTNLCYACSCPDGTVSYGAGACCGSPCRGWGNTRCDCVAYCFYTANRNVYRFFVRIIRSENGVVSLINQISPALRTVCSAASSFSPCTVASNDNINGIELTTSENNISLRTRSDSNAFYSQVLSINASNPNRGLRSGIIFTPGSNYLLDSTVQNVRIIGE
jgi:hypothetical protein